MVWRRKVYRRVNAGFVIALCVKTEEYRFVVIGKVVLCSLQFASVFALPQREMCLIEIIVQAVKSDFVSAWHVSAVTARIAYLV